MKKEKLSFILGVHCHQPVGNFGWVIEEAFEKSYRPFIDSLKAYPKIKATAHFSGPLLEWIEDNRPDFFPSVRERVEAGQLEIMGGGFYEPILMIIPQVDRVEQIEMMATYAEEKLGMRPKGVWLTERIWEPSLPKTFKNAGVSFTMTDDSHFFQAGLPAAEVHGYYMTEEEGMSTAVFPIDQHLRYAVPFKSPETTIEYLKKRYDAGDRSCFTLIDDGEKFGLWPGTYELLYSKEKWLDRFYTLLEKQSDWLEITTPSAYLEQNPPEGLAYLPTASYFEMGQWTLSPEGNHTLESLKKSLSKELGDDVERYLKGGFFRNFFMRYPESNHMHKRMLEISRKIHNSGLEGEPRAAAKRALFMAQCNCAYWHGIFGGLYLPHLRDAIYEYLIKAEAIAEDRGLIAESYDLEYDGKEEIHLRNNHLAAFLQPHDGASLLELDSVHYSANILNSLARRPEAYHARPETKEADVKPEEEEGGSIHDIVKEISAEDRKLLVYDTHRRSSFRDFLFDAKTPPAAQDLHDLKYEEHGALSTLAYEYEWLEDDTSCGVRFFGDMPLGNGNLHVQKDFTLFEGESEITADYNLRLTEGKPFSGLLGVQFNLSVPSALGLDTPFTLDGKSLPLKLLANGNAENAKRFSIQDPARKFRAYIETEQKADIAWHPVQTVSQSESGYDRNYQASAVWFFFHIELKPEEDFAFSVKLGVRKNA